MKISYNWLNNYINLNVNPTEVSTILTNIGLEVEKIEEVESIKGGLKGVVIGEIISMCKHPNADKLNLTKVDIGNDNVLQIVCGAPNVAKGLKVPVATVGTWLYDGDKKFKIKKGKIRGEHSFGMICSEKELGLGDEDHGIMIIKSNVSNGTIASEHFNLSSDTVFDIGLTPNRTDAMSHLGVARDIKAYLNYKGANMSICKPLVDKFVVDNTKFPVSVEVTNSKLCPRYSSVTISNVCVKESPNWIKEKLNAIGIATINNVVDITNFVLHETGQPLHAFDLEKIEEKIIVKTINDKTSFTTLDNEKRVISSDDLMICDSKKPLCIAGVFGGAESGVSNNTSHIFLESAYFDPISVRKTSKRHTLFTDASFRYERGCDPNITIYALKRATLLIQEICGGDISSEISDIYPKKINHFSVELNYSNMDSLVGEKIDRNRVKNILSDLSIEIVKEKKNGLDLLVPPFKHDVFREVDVIEEVLRIYGYNSVPVPLEMHNCLPNQDERIDISNKIANLLSFNGFNEIMNNSLTKSSYNKLIDNINESQNIIILNPLSNDLDVMRQTLLFGGLENIAHNHNRRNLDLKFFEFGKTYHKVNDQYLEKNKLQILITGNENHNNWNNVSKKVDFFFLKKYVENILLSIGIYNFSSNNNVDSHFSYGLNYFKNNNLLVSFGIIRSNILQSFGIKLDVFYAEFNFDHIEKYISNSIKVNDIDKFPSIRRDLSLLINKSITFEEIKKIAFSINNKILKNVDLFDVYEGENLPKEKKSYAISFLMNDSKGTLTDKYVDKIMDKLIQAFCQKLNAEIR